MSRNGLGSNSHRNAGDTSGSKVAENSVAWGMTAPLREKGILDMMGSR